MQSVRKKINKSPLIIKKILTPSPELSAEEIINLRDIIENCPGVFYKSRPVQQTVISDGEKWQLIFEDKEHYAGWLHFQRLDNRNYTAGELDSLFENNSGEE